MKEITLKAVIESIPSATAFIDEALEAYGCPLKAQMQIDVAVDELFSNIANYAYAPGTGEASVRFGFDEASRTASVTFIDSGFPFNPLSAPEPDTTGSAEDRPSGGLGIFLVRKTMDSVEYSREGGKNILTIRKKI